MGAREISGRISDGVDGDHRAESQEQADCRQSAVRACADQCCRSCQSAAREPQPYSIRQAKTQLRPLRRAFDSRACKTKETRGRFGVRLPDHIPDKTDGPRNLVRLLGCRDFASAQNQVASPGITSTVSVLLWPRPPGLIAMNANAQR